MTLVGLGAPATMQTGMNGDCAGERNRQSQLAMVRFALPGRT